MREPYISGMSPVVEFSRPLVAGEREEDING